MGPGGFALCVDACGPAGVPGAGGPGRCVCRWAAARLIDGVACGPTGVPGAAWCAVGPGCFVRPWAAARPLAVRAASCARRVVSKPGQAPPPPTGTAAWPSGPSGARHNCCTCGALRRTVMGVRFPPCPQHSAFQSRDTRCRMQFPDACVRFRCEKRGISTIAFQNMKCSRRNCMRMYADQIPHCPWGPGLGPAGQVVWLSETAVAFAGAGRASTETGIAFAGENWVFLARFSLALVMVVSRWPVSVVAEVSLVSPSPPQCVLYAKKFALRGLVVGVSAKKFALRAHNGPKLVFSGVLGELFRGCGVGGGVPGELFRACQPTTATGRGPPLPAGPMARPCGASGTLHIGNGGAFALHEAF